MRKITTGVILICMLVGSSLLFAGGGPNVSGAKLYIKQNDLEKAIGVLMKEVENVSAKKGSGSLNEDAWYLLGYIYARQGEYEKMMAAFDKAVELKPKLKEKGVKISGDSGSEFHSKFGTETILKKVWGKVFNEGVKYFNDALNASDESVLKGHDLKLGMSANVFREIIESNKHWEAINVEGGNILRGAAGLDAEKDFKVINEAGIFAIADKIDNAGDKINLEGYWPYYAYVKDGLVLDVFYIRSSSVIESGLKYLHMLVGTQEGLFEQAAETFKAAGTIAPDSVLAFQNMASAYMSMNKYEESIEPLKMALKHNPNDNALKTMLAQVYSTIGEDSLAMPILEELWAASVHTPDVADYLARGYIRADSMEAAKNVYKTAIEVSPDNFNFRYNYGTILLENKEHDKAIEQLLKAGEIDPESADINYNLGAAYLNRGVAKREELPEESEDKSYIEDFKLALPYLEKSIKTDPDDLITWFTLGRIAGQLNKIALSGYAFAKGEPTESALDNKVIVGMGSPSLKMILGEPNQINSLESEQFETVKEWVYKTRSGAKGKVAIPEPISVYVVGERVDALLIIR